MSRLRRKHRTVRENNFIHKAIVELKVLNEPIGDSQGRERRYGLQALSVSGIVVRKGWVECVEVM